MLIKPSKIVRMKMPSRAKILVWEYHKGKDCFMNFVGKNIIFWTGMDEVHVAILLDDYVFESTVWKDAKGKLRNGARKTAWIDWEKNGNPLPNRAFDLTALDWQVDRMKVWFNQRVSEHMPYNFMALLTFIVVAPSRWFWNIIGW